MGRMMQKTQGPKMLPCPCGSTDEEYGVMKLLHGVSQAECHKCGRKAPQAPTPGETRRAWNESIRAVNMHDRLVTFLKHHETFEAAMAATDDFNCEPAMIPPSLYNDLLGMRHMRDELLKEAQGGK